jgi:oxygen-independent coproporphyrinogen-3 oxidase
MYRQKNTAGNLENVGYSLPGHEGMYNVYIMEEIHSIFACGASAVTKFVADLDGVRKDIVRIFEAKYPYEYLRSREGGEADGAREILRRDAISFYEKHGL